MLEKPVFFVYVIESPSDSDIYDGRSESDILRLAINLNQIHCFGKCVISKNTFYDAIFQDLNNKVSELSEFYGNVIPIIHISAHGNKDGIGLSNGEFVSWNELGELLTLINKALDNSLIVCLSSCNGFSGTQMAKKLNSDLPFYALIGHKGQPQWSETAIAYAVFYHLLAKGKSIDEAVNAMNVASGLGENQFVSKTAENIQKSYLEKIEKFKREYGDKLIAKLRSRKDKRPRSY